jgi:EthD domain
MSDALIAFYHRPDDESPADFGKRLLASVAELADDDRAREVVLLVDDGDSGAPPEATAFPSRYDAALVTRGLPLDALPESDAAFAVSRRVIKARDRGRDGARSEGFTVVCPSVRAPFLTHEQFDAHWRDNHSRIHVASSPGTCHYEQLIIDDALMPGAPEWDGVGLLSFASAADYTERLFDGEAGQRAIFEDIPRFLDLDRGETLPATEYVFRDDD